MRIHSFLNRIGQPSSAYVISPFYSGKNPDACVEDCANAGINRLVIPFADTADGIDGIKESELVRVLQLRIDVLQQRSRLNAMCGNTGALGSNPELAKRTLDTLRNTLHSALRLLETYEGLHHAQNNDPH